MAESPIEKTERLRSLFHTLTEQQALLKEHCKNLEAEIEHLRVDVRQKEEAIQQLDNELKLRDKQYKALQLALQEALDDKQLRENKERFAKLVREIDKCITLLNE